MHEGFNMKSKFFRLRSFIVDTEESGIVVIDIDSAVAAETDDEVDGTLLKIPVFAEERAGYIYATPAEVAKTGRTMLCQEAVMWAKKSKQS